LRRRPCIDGRAPAYERGMSARSLQVSSPQAASLQASIDRFLQTVGASAKMEVEKAVRQAIASGKLTGTETVSTAVALSSEKIGLKLTIYGKIAL
jgi:hypothetical protein